ncbi:MAG: M23 family metallopeptidase [Deltaproteobacteria bacterium]|nr:M23 family metallopeptidase [Deltaproteobacteria bacterium]
MRRRPVEWLVLLASLELFACGASTRLQTTWDQDRLEGVPERSVATYFPAGPAKTAEKTRPAQRRVAANPRAVELALLRFTTQRRAIAIEHPAAKAWPKEMEILWHDLLGRIDAQLSLDDRVFSRRLLIQTRVTAEAERELTERRYGPCPEVIVQRLDRVFALVAHHIRKLRSPEEAARLASAASRPEMEWPVSPVLVTSGFGYRRDPIEEDIRFHSGLDLWANEGDLVTASAPGRVVHAGWLGGYGRAVIVQHPGSFQTVYGHLGQILVGSGAAVDGGSPIGFVGSSGRSTGPHLHFEVRREGRAIDPHDAVGMLLVSLLSPTR